MFFHETITFWQDKLDQPMMKTIFLILALYTSIGINISVCRVSIEKCNSICQQDMVYLMYNNICCTHTIFNITYLF